VKVGEANFTVSVVLKPQNGDFYMKIGLIDYYLDEFHANNYPAWISDATSGEIKAAYAYAKIDSPIGGLTTDQWCETYKIRRIHTIEEIVQLSDAIIVLSPDNPEQHEKLCDLPLKSGKPVYVDKTFAEIKEIAERIFAIADIHNTPCYSTSALRYATEFHGLDIGSIENISSWGPGPLGMYTIHQLEPIIAHMGPNICRVMFTGTQKWPSYVCEYTDGRRAAISHHGWECPFTMAISMSDGTTKMVKVESDFFKEFINDMVDFFRTGKDKVPPQETIAVIATREAAIKAAKLPGQWIAV